jgi:hypothetical protein
VGKNRKSRRKSLSGGFYFTLDIHQSAKGREFLTKNIFYFPEVLIPLAEHSADEPGFLTGFYLPEILARHAP